MNKSGVNAVGFKLNGLKFNVWKICFKNISFTSQLTRLTLARERAEKAEQTEQMCKGGLKAVGTIVREVERSVLVVSELTAGPDNSY